MNFIPLYSNTKQEREQRPLQQRNQNSRFFSQQNRHGEDEESGDDISTFPITADMQDVMRSLDGYVFVIDASADQNAGNNIVQNQNYVAITLWWFQNTLLDKILQLS